MGKEGGLGMKELDISVCSLFEPQPEYMMNEDQVLVGVIDGRPLQSLYGWWLCVCDYTTGDMPYWIPQPVSTDISVAWKVVEKLAPLVGDFKNADGFFLLKYGEFADHGETEDGIPSCVAESEEVDNKDTGPWSAHFHLGLIAEGSCPEHWGHGDCFCARGATAAEAICRAALLAMRKV
jgi:hypothetical protein